MVEVLTKKVLLLGLLNFAHFSFVGVVYSMKIRNNEIDLLPHENIRDSRHLKIIVFLNSDYSYYMYFCLEFLY